MLVLSAISDLATLPGPLVLAVGVFDGLHLGHRAVLQRAQLEAAQRKGIAVPLTFDPHPARVVRPDKAPLQLTHTEHKTRLLTELGFTYSLVLPFDQTLAATNPSDFIRALAQSARPLGGICVGYDWSFGKGRAGNLTLLRELGSQLHFEAVGVDAIEHNSEPISSTRIRNSIAAGSFQEAHAMLGRPYTVLGTVQCGKQIGRTIGFPTANLSLFNEQLPPNGVYTVRLNWNGKILPGVANLGHRPTVETESTQSSLEIHILDFEGDLYGETLEVEFLSFLRGEQRFPSIHELRDQIAEDVLNAKRFLTSSAVSAYSKSLATRAESA